MTMGYTRKIICTSILWIGLVLIMGCFLSLAHAGAVKPLPQNGAKYRIGFHFWKPGAIYDEAMEGIKDGLQLEGIHYEAVMMDADRDKTKAITNLRTLDAMGLDLIYSLSSDGTKIAAEIGMKTPVITTVVNHPASLGVEQENKNKIALTGTSYYVDAKKQLQFYRTLFPHIIKVGMIYDKKNNAGRLVEEPFMRQACQESGLQFISIGIEKKEELAEATKNLLQAGVDIIVVPTNDLVYVNLETMLEITHTAKIPVLSMNKQGVEKGALAGLFADTYKLGRYTAPLAKQILVHKAKPQDLPFQYIPEPDSILNFNEAEALGYAFPPEILGQATIVLQ